MVRNIISYIFIHKLIHAYILYINIWKYTIILVRCKLVDKILLVQIHTLIHTSIQDILIRNEKEKPFNTSRKYATGLAKSARFKLRIYIISIQVKKIIINFLKMLMSISIWFHITIILDRWLTGSRCPCRQIAPNFLRWWI